MKLKTITMLLLIVLAGCKKEKDLAPPSTTTQPPTTNQPPTVALNFAPNEALIKLSSDFYLIADVEGLTGVTLINFQDDKNSCQYGWGSNVCPGKSSCDGRFTFPCTISGTTSSCRFEAGYKGTGEGRSGLITQANSIYRTTAAESHGFEVSYKAPDGTYYYSDACNNPTVTWASVTMAERIQYGSSTTSPYMPGYYVKLKFNCELASKTTPVKKIYFKNAVARVAM